jgi:hypothetical protein
MKSKVLIAGAIVTIVIVCLIALVAITAALQGPANATQETYTLNGSVVNTYGNGMPGVVVTLHMMGADGSEELYNMTTVTNGTAPSVGQYIFTNVTPVDGTQFVYMTASVHAGDIGIYGRSNNYTLSNASAKSNFIVLHVPPEYMNATLSSP